MLLQLDRACTKTKQCRECALRQGNFTGFCLSQVRYMEVFSRYLELDLQNALNCVRMRSEIAIFLKQSKRFGVLLTVRDTIEEVTASHEVNFKNYF